MKKILKSLVGLALVASLALSFTLEPAYAAAEKLTYTESYVGYMSYVATTNNTPNYWGSLNVQRPKANKITAAKTSNKTTAVISSINNYNNKTEGSSSGWKYDNEGKKIASSEFNNSTDGTNYYSYIYYTFKKAGTATISFTVKGDKKAYTNKSKITIYKYENPVKKITATGINKNNSFAALTKTQAYGSSYDCKLKVTKAAANSLVTLTPNANWRVTYIDIYVYDKDGNSLSSSYNYLYGKAGQTATALINGLSKSNKYRIQVGYMNDKTGGSLYGSYYINY